MEKELSVDKVKYLKDVKTTKQTLISTVDLNNETADIKLDSYLMNISNAYVSENAIYLLNQKYNNDSKIPIKLLFGFKGVFGLEDYYEMDSESGYYTEIYKFDIKENVEYKAKTKVKGKTIIYTGDTNTLEPYKPYIKSADELYVDVSKFRRSAFKNR